MSVRVGVVGASGFLGSELLRLLAGHPTFEVAFATGDTTAGTRVADLYPGLAAAYGDLEFQPYEPSLADDADLVFVALPHGASQAIAGDLLKRAGAVVDLAADFRLPDAALYPTWYGEEHAAPELLGRFVYGIPELHRSGLRGADAVAVAGCYPTAAALALAPLVRTGAIAPEGVIVDAASGLSGAGRAPKDHTTFCAADGDVTAYGLLHHRHTPEIEQVTGAPVLFTPHLVPMSRGILATCYARPAADRDPLAVLAEAYAEEPFVVVSERSPSTKAALGSNTAHLTARRDDRTGSVVAICAIDNLVKGGSGQALQCANLVCGLEEAAGLPVAAVSP